jgi:threonyl-tRNA synthetase
VATKPDKALGDKKLWDKAEDALAKALEKNNIKYEIQLGEGAFYGPKIEIHVKDSLDRSWQLGTIQVDFNIAENFNLNFANKEGKKEKPLVIHRAVFGSFERFIGVLLEHTDGNLPLWLSPVQVTLVNVSGKQTDYCRGILAELKAAGIRAQCNEENSTLNKKIREAETERIPYIAVVGEKEQKNKTVSLRSREEKEPKEMGTDRLIVLLTAAATAIK